MTGRVVMLNGDSPGTSVSGRMMNVVEMARGLEHHGWTVSVHDVRRRVPFTLSPDADILHAHGYQGNYAASLFRATRASWREIPMVTTLHGWLWHGLKYTAMNRLELAALRDSDIVAVQSEAMRGSLAAKGFTNLAVVPTGIRASSDGEPPPRERPGVRVVYIGRISREKRLDVAIRGLAIACAEHEDIRLDVIGPLDDGVLVSQLIDLSWELGVNDRIRWWGQQSRPWSLVRPDIVVLASDTEGLPRVLLEATLRGLPIAATRVGGIPDIVRHESTGLLVEAGDHVELGRRLAELASDEGMRRRMALAALEWGSNFSFDVMIDRYEALYDGVTTRCDTAPA